MRLRRSASLLAVVAASAMLAPAATSAGDAHGLDHCGDAGSVAQRRACIEQVVRADARRSNVAIALSRLERSAEGNAGIAADCHLAMHPIGADAGEQLARVSRPFPLVRPRSFCHEGYVHGMQVAWLSAAPTGTLVRDGARVCDSSDPTADWACGHSLGHAIATRAPAGHGMEFAVRSCDRAYRSAVHLGLTRDGFVTTCTKGALMEFDLRDSTVLARDGCTRVTPPLRPWCDGHAWMLAGVGRSDRPPVHEELEACVSRASTTIGRRACVTMVARGLPDPVACLILPADLRAACIDGSELGPVNPASVPAS